MPSADSDASDWSVIKLPRGRRGLLHLDAPAHGHRIVREMAVRRRVAVLRRARVTMC
jgi:hypothetical protein